MDLFSPIDQYCERTDASFWSEPLNFTSNLIFVLAGLLIFKAIKGQNFRNRKSGSWFLAFLILSIGVGSALFHSFANGWSLWADVVPIAIFVLTYLWLFFRNTAGLSTGKSLVMLGGFGLLTFFAASVSNHDLANGSEYYFGTWIALFGITCFYAGRKQALNQWRMALAFILFSASLLLRTIDMKYCETWAPGTHAFWHILNGAVIFLISGAYVSERGRN